MWARSLRLSSRTGVFAAPNSPLRPAIRLRPSERTRANRYDPGEPTRASAYGAEAGRGPPGWGRVRANLPEPSKRAIAAVARCAARPTAAGRPCERGSSVVGVVLDGLDRPSRPVIADVRAFALGPAAAGVLRLGHFVTFFAAAVFRAAPVALGVGVGLAVGFFAGVFLAVGRSSRSPVIRSALPATIAFALGAEVRRGRAILPSRTPSPSFRVQVVAPVERLTAWRTRLLVSG